MEENTYELSVEVLDESTMAPLRGVNITVNDAVEVSDSEGMATFTSHSGPATYSLEKSSYNTISGVLEIKKDTLARFLLERSHADVKFRLREGSTPVNKVWVKVEEDSVLSDGLGLAKFLQLPIQAEYNYSTYRESYHSHSGAFYLTADTTIDLEMEKLSSAIEIKGREGSIRIWPNPTSGSLQIELADEQSTLLSIHDAHGKKIMETLVSGPLHRIDLGHLPPGLYSLSVQGGPGSLILKL